MIYVLKSIVNNDETATCDCQLFPTCDEAKAAMATAFEHTKALCPHEELPFSSNAGDGTQRIEKIATINDDWAEISIIEDGYTTDHHTWEVIADNRFMPKPLIPKVEIGKEYIFFYGSDDGDSRQLILHNGRRCKVIADSTTLLKNEKVAKKLRMTNGGLFCVTFDIQMPGDDDAGNEFDVYATELTELDDCIESKYGGFFMKKNDACKS